MQKCCSHATTRNLLHNEMLALRRCSTRGGRYFSVSSRARQDETDNAGRDDYKKDFPTSNKPNASTSRSTPRPVNLSQAPDRQILRRSEAPTPTSTSGPRSHNNGGPLKITREVGNGPAPRTQFLQRRPTDGLDARNTNAAAPGPLLRRVGFRPRTGDNQFVPGQNSPSQRGAPGRGGPRMLGQRGGRGGGRRDGDRPRRRRANDGDGDQEVTLTEDEVEDILMTGIETPQPKESTPYTPHDTTMEELKLDWPATALDPASLVEGVQQRAESLAKRIPHGFQTTHELAERLFKGEMVHFRSIEECDEVQKLANDLAKERADKLSERKGEAIPAEDMSYSSVVDDEKMQLAAEMVKGQYLELEKQRLPFLDMVVQQLRNNTTYHGSETAKFMEKVESLVPARAGRQGQQQEKRT